MDIVTGLPCSGKRKLAQKLSVAYESQVFCDPYCGIFDDYFVFNVPLMQDMLSFIRLQNLQKALAYGENIVISTVGSDADRLQADIERYIALGYKVHLFHCEVPNHRAVLNAFDRFSEEPGIITRRIDPSWIVMLGDSPTKSFETVVEQLTQAC